jgi:cyclin-dependent kinase 5 activator 1
VDCSSIENISENSHDLNRTIKNARTKVRNSGLRINILYIYQFSFNIVSNSLVNKRHSAFIIPSYQLSKSQSQYYHQHHHLQLSSYTKLNNGLSLSTKQIRSIEKSTTRKTIIQASTSELLRCLGEYLCSCCSHLSPILDPMDCILWIKSADRQLILQGWQEQVFVNPANIVFVYLLVRETLTYVIPSITIKSVTELHAIILTCLYLAFSYMGNEITYPLKPFVTDDETRDVFWQRVVLIMGQLSSKMLAINQNPKFFTECFSELKTYNLVH